MSCEIHIQYYLHVSPRRRPRRRPREAISKPRRCGLHARSTRAACRYGRRGASLLWGRKTRPPERPAKTYREHAKRAFFTTGSRTLPRLVGLAAEAAEAAAAPPLHTFFMSASSRRDPFSVVCDIEARVSACARGTRAQVGSGGPHVAEM